MFLNEDTVLLGFLIIIIGPLCSWIGSFMIYGFGQLVENSDILVTQGKKEPVYQNTANNYAANNNNSIHQWRCEGCGNITSESICPVCNTEVTDKINILNKWKEQGLITEEEYNQKIGDLK